MTILSSDKNVVKNFEVDLPADLEAVLRDDSMAASRKAAAGVPLSRISEEYKALEENDPLLRDNPQRWVMFPLQYPEVWEMYKKHEASFWTAEEIDLSQDLKDWEGLTVNERHFLKHVLAF